MKKMHKQNLEVCKNCVFAKTNVRVHRFHDQKRLRPNLTVKICSREGMYVYQSGMHQHLTCGQPKKNLTLKFALLKYTLKIGFVRVTIFVDTCTFLRICPPYFGAAQL